MSRYSIGVDFAKGDDYSCLVVARAPRWYEKLLFKLRLMKPFDTKVVKCERLH